MQIHSLLLAAGLSLASIALAAANRPPEHAVNATFGNTVLSIYGDGRSQKVYLHPDGAWDGYSRRGNPLAGAWKLKGEQVCVKQTRPATLPISFCMPLPENPHVGSTWPAKDLTGAPIQLKIVKGKVTTYNP